MRIQHDAFPNASAQRQQMAHGILEMIEDPNMMDEVGLRYLLELIRIFNVTTEDLGVLSEHCGTDDRLDDIFDSGVDRGDPTSELAQGDGMNALKATNFQYVLPGQIEVLMHHYNSKIGDSLGGHSLAIPGAIAKAPTLAVHCEAPPRQNLIERGKLFVT
jgi:hypothetical protein